jgi:hypothetical protein
MTIKRISDKEIRKIGRPGVEEVVPAGIPPILRHSWNFARDLAKRFSRELLKDRSEEFLKKLIEKFK